MLQMIKTEDMEYQTKRRQAELKVHNRLPHGDNRGSLTDPIYSTNKATN